MEYRNYSMSSPLSEESDLQPECKIMTKSPVSRPQSQPFPTLSPTLAPEIAQAVDVVDIPPLDDTDDEELLPTIQDLLGSTRTRSSQRQSQGKRRRVVPTVKPFKEGETGTEPERESSSEDPTVSGTENSMDERDDEEKEEPDDAEEDIEQLEDDEVTKVKEEEPQAMDFASAAASASTSVSVKRKPRPLVPITPQAHKPRPGSLAAPIEIAASPSDTTSPTAVSPCGKRSRVSDDIRSTKRARKVRLLAKHETHWYLDGNVIVEIKNTQFKLHRSRLVRMSDWFRAKFEPCSMGHDPKGISHLGNDVVVGVDDDNVTAEDFEILLDAFDDAMSVPLQFPLLSFSSSFIDYIIMRNLPSKLSPPSCARPPSSVLATSEIGLSASLKINGPQISLISFLSRYLTLGRASFLHVNSPSPLSSKERYMSSSATRMTTMTSPVNLVPGSRTRIPNL